MRYWWVNHKQTSVYEVGLGFLWSPKKKKNGDRNYFYDTMTQIAPGDVVFSYSHAKLIAIGVVQSYCMSAPQPVEFGKSGQFWDDVGWKVNVDFTRLQNEIRPKEHIEKIWPLFPKKYYPLKADGDGLTVYLTEIDESLAKFIVGLIGPEAEAILQRVAPMKLASIDELDLLDAKVEQDIEQRPGLDETQRSALILARVGQGKFKSNVFKFESKCRITGVDNPAYLIASHCKPWRISNDSERLDGENGLLLTPSIDRLFDRGYIAFETDGTLIISPEADRLALAMMGVNVDAQVKVGEFTKGQSHFLEYHRTKVFPKAKR